jgi:membrane associated rhomboid family serine protease
MYYELALVSVAVAAAYWGVFFVRRRPGGSYTFGLMQLASAALAVLGLLGREYDVPALGIAGAIGIGGGTCLLVVGPLVRSLARRFALAERLGIAARLLDLAELLAPGSGVAEEKALLGAMREIRDGHIEHTVDALTAAKDRAPADARLAIDERIAMLYLAAYRWDDAIAHAEAHLFGASPPSETPDGKAPLRAALGLAPPVWVELLGAYGRKGDLDRAATMLDRLEDACVGRDDAAMWLHRARLMFLALAGRTVAVRTLTARRRARHMSAAARTYWVAVSHEHSGDRSAATAAYEKARGRSRGKPRELIDQALARMANIAPAKLSETATQVVARVEAAPPPKWQPSRSRRTWATPLVTAAIFGVAAVLAIGLGSTGDIGVLVRGGALVHSLVHEGEWWRLVTCIFIHVGGVHLVVNGIGLWMLGRLTEELFGGARTITIFAIAGLAGSLASYLASPVGISAGASGAIFGLLGALFVELVLHRQKYRQAWKGGMMGSLAVVTVAQVGVGFLYPVIDQWAHAAGLLGGALAGLALSPSASWARTNHVVAKLVAIAFGAVVAVAAVLATLTSIPDSLDALPTAVRRAGDIAVTAPVSWTVASGIIQDPDGLVELAVERQPRTNTPLQLGTWIASATQRAKSSGFDQVETVGERVVALPVDWEGKELDASAADPMGYRQHFRVIVCGRAFADSVIVASLTVPDTIARAAPAFLAQLIASLGPAE